MRALLAAVGLPQAGLEEHILNFMLALEGEKVVGCAGLEIYQNSALLRSVVVAEEYRSLGIGAKLTEGMIDLARYNNLSSLSLLTETAADFFSRFGFAVVARTELPAALQASQELQGACPDTAIAMTLSLTPPSED